MKMAQRASQIIDLQVNSNLIRERHPHVILESIVKDGDEEMTDSNFLCLNVNVKAFLCRFSDFLL